MSSTIPVRAVLMASEITAGSTGFNRLVFKVDGGRNGMAQVTVLISQDAHRKLTQQMARARFHRVEPAQLLRNWALWEIGARFQEQGTIPATLTITASDLDEFGAYASDLARSMQLG